MPSSFRRSLPITGVAVIMTAALALAGPHVSPAPHVRPETADAQSLFAELVDRSMTARGLVDELDRSPVLVYVRHRVFPSMLLDGRIGFAQSAGPSRFLIIELACTRPRLQQLVTFGHELQHAVEIARAPAVVSAPTLAAHFSRIGIRTNGITESLTFETTAAIRTSAVIRQELLGMAARTTHDRN